MNYGPQYNKWLMVYSQYQQYRLL